MLRWCLLAGGLVLSLATMAAGPGFHAQFVGGTIAGVRAGSAIRLDLTSPDALLVRAGNGADLRISYQRINTLEYGQNVSRRYVSAILVSPLLLLAKSRKHYLTIGYVDSEGHQEALVFRVDKDDIRSALAGLEARTGRRIEFQDAEARKASRG